MFAHPAVQVPFATASLAALLQGNALTLLAVPGALYYLILVANQIRNAPTGWLGSVFAKAQAIWTEDKPYLVMLAGFGFAASQYFHYPIPEWLLTATAFAGLGTFHSYAKGKTVP